MSSSFRTNYREPEPAPASLLSPPPARHEIFVPLEPDDLMLGAACYLFWPVLAPVVMLGRRSRIAFVRFHCVQATWFGVLATALFGFVTVLVMGAFRAAATPERLWEGWVFVAAFLAWLAMLLSVFLMTLFFAWRAGQGHIFRLPFVGASIERRALEVSDEEEAT